MSKSPCSRPNRARLHARTYLPAPETVATLQDKFASARLWQAAGIWTLPTVAIDAVDDVQAAADELGLPLWMRARSGAGARGATLVEEVVTGVHWFNYWRSRGVRWEFIAQRYLPGRDFAFQSLWRQGELITSQARERLEYIYPYLAPSGRTGTPVVAVTVHDERINAIATACVRSVDANATGIFCVDLREGEDGRVYPTEINAGRFFTTSYFFTAAGVNMPHIYVQLGHGEDPGPLPRYNAVAAGQYWIRHIDCPAVLAADADLRGIPYAPLPHA